MKFKIDYSFGHKMVPLIAATFISFLSACHQEGNLDSQQQNLPIAQKSISVIEKRLSPSTLDEQGWTPLHRAVKRGDFESVKTLVQQGADINQTIRDGLVLDWTPLHMAAYYGRTEIAKYLVDQGADLERESLGRETPLKYAVEEGHFQIVEYLVEKGAKIDNVANDSWTPLLSAAKYNYLDVFNCLINHGADKTVTDSAGWTPLHLASYYGNLEMVKILLQQGAEINSLTFQEWTALSLASAKGNLEIVKELLAHGADVDKADKDGWVPLHFAARIGHSEIVDALVLQGASIDKVNMYGFSPLSFAVFKGHKEIANYLIQNGADLFIKTKRGRSIPDLALQPDELIRSPLDSKIELDDIELDDIELEDENPSLSFDFSMEPSTSDEVKKELEESLQKAIASYNEPHSIIIHCGKRAIEVTFDRIGSINRSLEFFGTQRIRFYKSDVEKVLHHLKNKDSFIEEKSNLLGRNIQFKFKNGDVITVSNSEADKFRLLFNLVE